MLEKVQLVQYVEMLKSKKEILHKYLEDVYAESFNIEEIEEVDQSFKHLYVYYSVIFIEEADETLRNYIQNWIDDQLELVSEIIVSNINMEKCIDDFLEFYYYSDIFDGIVLKTNNYIIIEH